MIPSNAKKLLWALSIVVLSCSVVGRGGGLRDVSERSARKSYEKTTVGISSGDLKVISFRKIDARRSERVGEKVCDVEYEAELEYLKGPEKGKVFKSHGSLPFRQTEKGWEDPFGDVY